MLKEEPVAWLLNLDAEMEYAAPLGYTPNQALLRLIEERTEALRHLIGPALIVRAQGGTRGIAKGRRGVAWSPTPHALRQLARSGATLPEAPEFEVLRRANSRTFCAQLGQTLADAHLFETAAMAVEFIRNSHRTQRWLLKRIFGFAGRGQRKMRKDLSLDDLRWLGDSEKTGGVQLEPLLKLELELTQHGHLAQNGELSLGQLCVQHTDPHRAWQRTEQALPNEVPEAFCERLRLEATTVAEALQRLGYFGPFGIDSFTYRNNTGELTLNPRSEINARYSMGYATGMRVHL